MAPCPEAARCGFLGEEAKGGARGCSVCARGGKGARQKRAGLVLRPAGMAASPGAGVRLPAMAPAPAVGRAGSPPLSRASPLTGFPTPRKS